MSSKSVFSFFVLLLAYLPAKAQNATPFEKSLFWEVSKGKHKLYILGTHHLYPNDFVKQSEAIQQALKKADVVVGEIVIDTNQMRMAMKMMRYMFMTNNTLDKLLSKEDFKLLDEYMKKNVGNGVGMMNMMKPLAVYQMILAKKYMDATGKKTETSSNMQGTNLDNSIDAYVQKEGTRMKKKIRGLEEVEDQAEILFNGYPLERQAEMLMEVVKNEKAGSDDEIVEMDKIYAEQDIEKLFAMTQKHMTPEETKILLTNRNNKWIPQLEKMLEYNKVSFIAVGAGHLVGESGVLTQLRTKGYSVKPVQISTK